MNIEGLPIEGRKGTEEGRDGVEQSGKSTIPTEKHPDVLMTSNSDDERKREMRREIIINV